MNLLSLISSWLDINYQIIIKVLQYQNPNFFHKLNTAGIAQQGHRQHCIVVLYKIVPVTYGIKQNYSSLGKAWKLGHISIRKECNVCLQAQPVDSLVTFNTRTVNQPAAAKLPQEDLFSLHPLISEASAPWLILKRNRSLWIVYKMLQTTKCL